MRMWSLNIVFLLLPISVFANSMNEARQSGEALANSKQSSVVNSARSNIDGATVEVLNYQGIDLPEVNYNDANIYSKAKEVADNKDNEVATTIKEGFLQGKEFEVTAKDSFLDKARDVEQNPQNYVDFLSGKYTDCQSKTEDITSKEEVTCDDYTKYNEHQCSVGREVVVDAKHNYLCRKKRNTFSKKCEEALQLTCKKTEECDTGGIILTSMSSDMKWQYQYPYLVLGTIANNYWSGNCTKYDRTTTFEVKNKDLIQEFTIVSVGFDDHLRISINGQQVYMGPYGGDRLENSWGLVDSGKGRYPCELSTDWHFNVNIDLRPYLKEGSNSIRMEVIVSGVGEGWMRIKTKQHCCKEWQEEWVEECGGQQ